MPMEMYGPRSCPRDRRGRDESDGCQGPGRQTHSTSIHVSLDAPQGPQGCPAHAVTSASARRHLRPEDQPPPILTTARDPRRARTGAASSTRRRRSIMETIYRTCNVSICTQDIALSRVRPQIPLVDPSLYDLYMFAWRHIMLLL